MPLKWLKLSKYFTFCSKIYGTVNETLKSYLKLLCIVKWNATNQLHFQVSVLWTRHFSVTSNYQVELIRLINPVNHKRAKLKLEAKIAVRQNPRRSKRNEPEEEKWSVKSRWRHSVTMDEDVVTTQWNQLLCHHKQFFPPFFYYYWLICFHGFFFRMIRRIRRCWFPSARSNHFLAHLTGVLPEFFRIRTYWPFPEATT